MKKVLLYLFIAVFIAGIVLLWMAFGPGTAFRENSKYIYVYENRSVKEQVQEQINKEAIIHNVWLFNILANQFNVWNKLKAGRFKINKNASLLNIVRMLRNNTQSPVRLVINKLRTHEDLARLLGKNFVSDSAQTMHFISNSDSLEQLSIDSNSLLTLIIPNTYILKWNTSVKKILLRLHNEKNIFWKKNNRLQKAEALNFTPQQIYILASIVEEETNKNDEKGNIASVYMNRLTKGMPLGADPTVRFALKDFTIKRIFYGHLSVNSAYNTYRYKGLPPGPICTPSPVTIDAVLNASKTDYLFFVAKSDFSGYHHFSNSYAEHEQYAKFYQQALNEWMLKNQNK